MHAGSYAHQLAAILMPSSTCIMLHMSLFEFAKPEDLLPNAQSICVLSVEETFMYDLNCGNMQQVFQ